MLRAHASFCSSVGQGRRGAVCVCWNNIFSGNKKIEGNERLQANTAIQLFPSTALNE